MMSPLHLRFLHREAGINLIPEPCEKGLLFVRSEEYQGGIGNPPLTGNRWETCTIGVMKILVFLADKSIWHRVPNARGLRYKKFLHREESMNISVRPTKGFR
jgi:hypothetical protein